MDYLNTARRKFSKFQSFSLKEKTIFTFVLISYPFFQMFLRLISYKKTIKIVQSLKRQKNTNTINNNSSLDRNFKVVSTALNNSIFSTTCLEKSVFFHLILNLYAVDSKLQIGIKKNGDFSAHAWVEYNGKPLNDETDELCKHTTFDKLFTY